ncbi:hypothetical protein ACWDYJ_07765 [Streptomyces sp. NPDC003042]
MAGEATAPGFQPVIDHTHCPYARASSWLHSDTADERLTVAEHLDRALPRLREALVEVAADRADGFVLELPGRLGQDVETLRESALDVLRGLAARSSTPSEVTMADLEDPAWWFRFDEERLFTVAFGSCFGTDHTRYAFGAKGFFLLFQHQSAFSRRHPEGIPMRLRERIRDAFDAAGRAYRYDMGVVPALGTGVPGREGAA